ncbi:WD repeat-containing protein 64-like [Tubulanus polymorphus]|uniref:WD repeat-containing protein 64-like n=1 Tax=Tubulanus polymorphus TaxID=672921 RepID=UPI003DA1EE17
MSTLPSKGGLPRPYTLGTFQKRLNDFQAFINEITFQDIEATPEERRLLITESLRFDQFCDTIRSLFGSEVRNNDLKLLYRKISTNPDAKIDWSELFFHTENEEPHLTIEEDVTVFTVSKKRRIGEAAGDKKRRDVVQTIKVTPSLEGFLVTSQKGTISIWTSKLRLQTCCELNESAWVTGCDYLPGIRRVLVASERSISIWDNRAKSKTQNIFTIKPMPSAPQCVTWVPWTSNAMEDTILFGDDHGNINLMTIASKDLNMKNSKDDNNSKNQTEAPNLVIDPEKLTYPIHKRKIHEDWVIKIDYIPELGCFASCSPSSSTSFVLEEIDRIMDNGEIRGMSLTKGVNAFAFCKSANMIATGGVDKIIRVWHPHIFSRPTGKLLGHLFTIVDIAVNEKDQHIISLSTARVIRVWDISTLTSLQVFTDNEERPGERRIYSMVFDDKSDRLLTGSSVIDAWPLTRAVQDTMQVPHTHDRPINQVYYNNALNQVITVCTESVMKIWEMESGKFVYAIKDPHGPGVEMTALCFDKTGFRMATGGFDGSICIWDVGAGQKIKHRSGRNTDEDLSIVGMAYYQVRDKRCIAVAGWTNKIRLLVDSNEANDLPILREFNDFYQWPHDSFCYPPLQGEQRRDSLNKLEPLPEIGHASVTDLFRKEYILTNYEMGCTTVNNDNPNQFITSCANGHTIIWDVENSSIDKIIQKSEGPATPSISHHRRRQALPFRIHKVDVLIHKTRRLDPKYIKSLLTTDDAHSTLTRSRQRSRTTSTMKKPSEKTPEEAVDETIEKTTEIPESNTNAGIAAENEIPSKSGPSRDETYSRVDGGKSSVDENPEEHMLVEVSAPVMVTCHHDSFVRFWNMEGEMYREITPMARCHGSPVTAVCTDQDCNVMVTGDLKGYVVLWDIGKFLEDPNSEDPEAIKQLISWRAHLTKIVSLVYVDSKETIISASTDGSVRLWWGRKGRFVGFFGQVRPLTFPSSELNAGTPTLPYDITEGPLIPAKHSLDRQKLPTRKFEYPLKFDNQKWRPVYSPMRLGARKPTILEKKFFRALIKPKAYRDHLETFTTAEMKSGAVFRALPVYRVKTPEKPSTPLEIKRNAARSDNFGAMLPMKTRRRSIGRMSVGSRAPSVSPPPFRKSTNF